MDKTIKTGIVFTVTNDLSFDQRMIRICSTLSEAGYDVILVGRKKKQSIPLKNQPFACKRLPCWFEKGKLFYLEYNLRLLLYLLFNARHIISAVDNDTLAACALAAKIRSKKLVFDAHEYFTEVPEVVNRPLTKKVWHTVARFCIPHVHRAYTVSASLAGIFENLYHHPFSVIRNVPFLHQLPTPAIKDSYIIYQGDLNEGRGLEEMIAAMPEINRKLLIAGNGPLLPVLQQLVNTHRLQDKVVFLGYLDAAALAETTAKAWLGLNLLKHQGESYYYSLSNKFFNYIHAGLPQLCAGFPEYRHINETYPVAIWCNCSTDDILQQVKELELNPEQYEKMRKACVIAAQTFNWQTEKQILLNIYQELSN